MSVFVCFCVCPSVCFSPYIFFVRGLTRAPCCYVSTLSLLGNGPLLYYYKKTLLSVCPCVPAKCFILYEFLISRRLVWSHFCVSPQIFSFYMRSVTFPELLVFLGLLLKIIHKLKSVDFGFSLRRTCFCCIRPTILLQTVRSIPQTLLTDHSYQHGVLIDAVKCTNAYRGLTSYLV
jgi:hypothetical protein